MSTRKELLRDLQAARLGLTRSQAKTEQVKATNANNARLRDRVASLGDQNIALLTECASLRAALKEALDLVGRFTEAEDGCSFDHHGYCQAHGWMGAGTCPHGDAPEWLATASKLLK